VPDLMKQIEKELQEDRELAKFTSQEELILDVTELILEKMEKKNLNKSQLAEKLRTNKSHITQLLRGSRNMTLRTISDIFFELDYKIIIDAISTEECGGLTPADTSLFIRHHQSQDWKLPDQSVTYQHTEASQNRAVA
jgi:transcriptional regulator with XRE-family HTH domain